MPNSKVAVVILNWNGVHFLEKFLPSVLNYSSEARIIVADNLSTDHSIEFLRQNFPEVEIIQNRENAGFAKGYNDALEKVDSEYLVLLNSDVEVTENWIFPVISWMDENPSIAACQPKILDYYNKTQFEYAGASGGYIDSLGYPFCRGRIFNECEKDNGQYDQKREVFWATGACMFIRKSDFFAVGGFDADYFAHMEEIDLCWRLKNKGRSIWVVPDSTVYHVGGGTLKKVSPRKTYLNFRNNLVTFLKNDRSKWFVIKLIYRLLLDGVAGIKFCLSGSPRHCLAVIRAHFSFYLHFFKTINKRRALQIDLNTENKSGIYNGSIVFAYYLKRKKYFSDLDDRFT